MPAREEPATEPGEAVVRKPEWRLRVVPGWVASHETVEVAGRDIGGMIYFGTAPRVGDFNQKCSAYVDPSLKVAGQGGDLDGKGMPYRPSYSEIVPRARATYLDWLASGRKDARYNPGYMFLYFYGLERRFFNECPGEAEKREIVAEVERLKTVYSESRSVQRYLGRFLDIARIDALSAERIQPIFERQGDELPTMLGVVIGATVWKGEAINADWALSWLACHPDGRLRIAALRCLDEFRELFRIRFAEIFPDGLAVAKPKRTLEVVYRASSGEFEASVTPLVGGIPVPDISSLQTPLSQIETIADRVTEELERFSRSDLHSSGVVDGRVAVRQAELAQRGEAVPAETPAERVREALFNRVAQRGEAVPAETPPARQGPRLDASRIDAIQHDTARASSLLGDIFDEEAEQGETDEVSVVSETALPGLDEKNSEFVRALIERERWTEEEVSALVKGIGLMQSGALEAVNEWAFENFGDALIEEYQDDDDLELAPAIVAQVRQMM